MWVMWLLALTICKLPCRVPSHRVLPTALVLTNTVTAPTAAPETNTANNIAQATTLVGAPDVAVVKTGPASVTAGDTLTFTLTYSNAGT